MGAKGRWLWLAIVPLIPASLWACGVGEQRFKGFKAEDYFADARLVALAKAGCEGDVASVKRLAGGGVEVNGTGKNKMTPLIWTIHCRNIAGVKALLEAGANPNQKDNIGLTPFLIAIDYDDQAMLGTLIDHKANLYEVGPGDNSAIVEAFDHGFDGKWGNYYLLLDRGLDINHVYGRDLPDLWGTTIALHAAALGRFDKIIELIERGYNRDLGELAVAMHIHQTDPNAPAWGYKQKLIAILKERGVPYDQLARDFDAGERKPHLEQY
jgi:ankyrin repeat protein